jgi:hypothetical protein
MTLNGALLSASGSTFSSTGSGIQISDGASFTAQTSAAATLFQLTSTAYTLDNASFTVSLMHLFGTRAGGTVAASATIGGLLFAAGGSELTMTGHTINVGGGATLVASGTPLLHLDGAELTVDTTLTCCGGQVMRNGLLGVFDTGPGGTLRSTATIEGELLRARDSLVSLNGTAIVVSGGGRLIATSAPLIRLDNTALEMSTTNFNSLLGVFGTSGGGVPSSAQISGGLLVAGNNSTLATGTDLIVVNGGASLTASGVPLLRIDNVALDLRSNFSFGGNPVRVGLLLVHATAGGSPSTASVSGGLLLATDATIAMTNSAINVFDGAALTATSVPLIDLVRSTFTAGGLDAFASLLNIFTFPAAASANVTGGLLRATDGSTVTMSSPAVNVSPGVTLTASGTPLLQLDDAQLVSGNANFGGGLLGVNGDASARATATISGGLLTAANGSAITTRGNAINVSRGDLTLGPTAALQLFDSSLSVLEGQLLSVSNGGTLSSSGEILRAERSQVTTAFGGIFVGGATWNASGAPVLRATDSTVTIGDRLINAQGNGALTTALPSTPAAAYALVALDFSNAGKLTTGQHAIDVLGAATENFTDPDFGVIPSLGTDRPLHHQGGRAMLDITAARTDPTVNTFDVEVSGNAVRVDTALMEATAPFVTMLRSSMKTSGDAVNIFQKARVVAGIDVLRLDQSRLDIVNGNLMNVAGGSLVRMNNLLTVANGSRVNILNGTLLTVSGNSFVSMTGCLVCFAGNGSVVTVSNGIAPTGNLFGLPIAGTVDQGSRTAASVFPGLGTNGNTINVTGGGVLLQVTNGSTLKLQ